MLHNKLKRLPRCKMTAPEIDTQMTRKHTVTITVAVEVKAGNVFTQMLHVNTNTIRYDTRCYFNVRSKADISQLNILHGTNKEKVEKRKSKKRICSEVSANNPGNPWSQS